MRQCKYFPSLLAAMVLISGGCLMPQTSDTIKPVLSLGASESEGRQIGWEEAFELPEESDNTGTLLPRAWTLKARPGTPPAVFRVVRETASGESYLSMKATQASGALVRQMKEIDISKYPILEWRWRIVKLPTGADGRQPAKDDQAIGIYVGTGKLLGSKSVSYRWDTETPKGASDQATYGGGITRIKWFTIKNRLDCTDDGSSEWFTERRHVATDFKKAWGFLPESVHISVSCNSQYTKSIAAAELAWIRFVSDGSDPSL